MPRADGLRIMRIAICVLFIGLLATIVMFVVGFKLIQFSREDTVRRSCLEQNHRHDQTVRALDQLLAIRRRTASAKELERLQESRTNTLLLIDALARKQDCEARVNRLTR